MKNQEEGGNIRQRERFLGHDVGGKRKENWVGRISDHSAMWSKSE